MNLLRFKSGYNEIVCHPDKVDYFITSAKIKSGVVINGNFMNIAADDIDRVVEEYQRLVDILEDGYEVK
jgi:hypothetical protein